MDFNKNNNTDGGPGWKWSGSKEITLAVIMVIVILIVIAMAIWNYVTLKRRRIENAARRETELDEQRLNAKEKRKKRQAAIDEALVCNVSESMAFSFSTLYS
jgi:flagellar biosynthesis/type III secretory pathway M-ring protein FliF/YscJ